jgi:hypothetical protein
MTDVVEHEFSVQNAWWDQMNLVLTDKNEILRVPNFAYCEVHSDDGIDKLMINVENFPAESKMVMQLARCLRATDRGSRYLNLYKIYESLTKDREVKLAVIRHSLSHDSSVLTRPKIIEALTNDFGGIDIDLSKYRNERVFWQRYGELFILVETIIKDRLLSIKSEIAMPINYVQFLTESVAKWDYPDEYPTLSSNKNI